VAKIKGLTVFHRSVSAVC